MKTTTHDLRIDLDREFLLKDLLKEGEVHVLVAPLEPKHSYRLTSLLSHEELERAGRFVFPKDRSHFVVARGLLRKLLGGYLEVPPERLEFGYGANGKPLLQPPEGRLRFNLAHSHQLAVYAFSLNRELGIDVEHLDRELDYERLARRFFAQGEQEVMSSLPPELRRQAFFNCWTRKEAYIKARGDGLSFPLSEFNVSLVPGDAPALLSNSLNSNECSRWIVEDLPVGSDYTGALVAEGPDLRLKVFFLSFL